MSTPEVSASHKKQQTTNEVEGKIIVTLESTIGCLRNFMYPTVISALGFCIQSSTDLDEDSEERSSESIRSHHCTEGYLGCLQDNMYTSVLHGMQFVTKEKTNNAFDVNGRLKDNLEPSNLKSKVLSVPAQKGISRKVLSCLRRCTTGGKSPACLCPRRSIRKRTRCAFHGRF